jgi:hypothetical protein
LLRLCEARTDATYSLFTITTVQSSASG